MRIPIVSANQVIADEELAFAQQLLPSRRSVVDMGQSISASTLANKVDRSDSDYGIHPPMPAPNLLWSIDLTIVGQAVAIGCKMDIDMTVKSPYVFTVHFGCTSDEFGDGCLLGEELRR